MAIAEATLHFHPTGPLVALVGNPNCGKTALFNRLTGGRQHVANYAGVTVERKEGKLLTDGGKLLRILDLPGVYSLYPRSPDEKVTADVLAGRAQGEKRPDMVVCVVDATNLRRSLRLVLAVLRTGIPCVLALNLMDEARTRGIDIDAERLSKELGIPVAPTVAVRKDGDAPLRQLLADRNQWPAPGAAAAHPEADAPQIEEDHHRVQAILNHLGLDGVVPDTRSDRLDKVLLHPLFGPAILVLLLFTIFQAMFIWSQAPMDWLGEVFDALKTVLLAHLPDHWLRSLLLNGVVDGALSVVVFLPQILVLFLFILLLEESGYLPRAAYLLDRLMGSVGLSGRSFIPLLSSFACAVPGIMAMRTIPDPRDRRVTMLIAPLMTCSARLPVYTLLIGAFIPARRIWGGLQLQGVVMFALYVAGILGALLVAWILKTFTVSGKQVRPLMMELPTYRWPNPLNIGIGLWQRARMFMSRVGGIILTLSVVMWILSSLPLAPAGAAGTPIEHSFAGLIGRALAVVLEPIGFNWQIAVALVPGMAAREVVISSLGTVYAMSASAESTDKLLPLISGQWSLATGLALLAWFVFAPQCLSTLAVLRRESGGWRIPVVAVTYLFGMAYLAAFVVYRVASLWV
ncbi:MAG: ferrous iron transporter B [Burkholderiales bacterium]|nr:ferrous iron transporter B [Burkholderiales bacterium]